MEAVAGTPDKSGAELRKAGAALHTRRPQHVALQRRPADPGSPTGVAFCRTSNHSSSGCSTASPAAVSPPMSPTPGSHTQLRSLIRELQLALEGVTTRRVSMSALQQLLASMTVDGSGRKQVRRRFGRRGRCSCYCRGACMYAGGWGRPP